MIGGAIVCSLLPAMLLRRILLFQLHVRGFRWLLIGEAAVALHLLDGAQQLGRILRAEAQGGRRRGERHVERVHLCQVDSDAESAYTCKGPDNV